MGCSAFVYIFPSQRELNTPPPPPVPAPLVEKTILLHRNVSAPLSVAIGFVGLSLFWVLVSSLVRVALRSLSNHIVTITGSGVCWVLKSGCVSLSTCFFFRIISAVLIPSPS